MSFSSQSQHAWEAHHCARLSAQRQNATHAVVDGLLCNGRFDAAAITWMTHRERYADAATFLVSIARSPRIAHCNLLPILMERRVSDAMRLFRLCAEYGAKPGTNLQGSTAGRMALAASGSLRSWRDANRTERAAFTLGALVRGVVS